jgi:hypothetical protein
MDTYADDPASQVETLGLGDAISVRHSIGGRETFRECTKQAAPV